MIDDLMTNDRRLIEDFIPIREISAESAREKSIRKGHISTLHLWWARRPLVASRAAVFASLVGAPESYQKRTALSKFMVELCQWKAGDVTISKAKQMILEAQRDRLNLPPETPLKDVPAPKVLDMFAGGGAIPLEALRLGCETYAVDLNPVAHIIELCTLVYPQKYGKKLADEVETWGQWVIEKVRAEIGDLYPPIKVGEVIVEQSKQMSLLGQPKQAQLKLANELTPVAYLWTRTVKCPNPACGAQVPLVRQTWLCKKENKYVALKVTPNHDTKRVEFDVVEAQTAKALGFDPSSGSSRGNSTCRHCGTTLGVKHVKKEGTAGRIKQQFMAVVCTTAGEKGKTYLAGPEYEHYVPDEVELKARLERLCKDSDLTTPDESLPKYGVLGFRVQPYGLLKWQDLFTTRQLLALMTFVKWVRLAHEEMVQQGYEEGLAVAITTYLGLCIGKVEDRSSSVCVWAVTHENIVSPVSNGRLPMNWDFPESNPIVNASGSWFSALDYLLPALRNFCQSSRHSAILIRGNCSSNANFSDDSIDAVITDPPYFDAVPYADLSDYFYVFQKRSIGQLYPEHFSGYLTPKKNEAIMEPSRHGNDKQKAAQAYEHMMFQAFCEANRILKPNGCMVVVYAHKTTAGWSTLIDSLRQAKFTIVEAWPLDTERPSGLRILRASLASSIFLIARKRNVSEVGDYATDVRPKLAEIVRERVTTLMAEGVTGADLVIACIGAGLRAYTQYERVELPNGDELPATTFLDEVQKEVVESVLTNVLECDRKGVSLVDKPTQFYIMGRYEYREAEVDFDEMNTLAKGVGIELDGASGITDGKQALVQKTKNKVQLRDYQDRGMDEDLGQGTSAVRLPSLIDILHRMLWLAEHKPSDISSFLSVAQPDATQLRLVAQALAGRALTPNAGDSEGGMQRTREQSAIDTFLASWKRLVEDNLFTTQNR